MALADERRIQKGSNSTKKINQNITIENREKITMTGVNDVECFNDDCIIAQTELGRIILKGSGMKVNKLNLENSELQIEGYINYFEYVNKKKRKKRIIFGG